MIDINHEAQTALITGDEFKQFLSFHAATQLILRHKQKNNGDFSTSVMTFSHSDDPAIQIEIQVKTESDPTKFIGAKVVQAQTLSIQSMN